MGGMDVAAVASPWIMEGWLASFHRPCRASNLPASKTCRCVEPFLLAFGTAESNQPASKFREDDEGASRATTSSDPSVTTGMTHCERGTDVMSDKSLAKSQCQRGNLTVRPIHPGSSKRNCWHKYAGMAAPTTKAPELFGSPMAGAPLLSRRPESPRLHQRHDGTHHINSPRSIGTQAPTRGT